MNPPPQEFERHPNVDPYLQDKMEEAEILGGVDIRNVEVGKSLLVTTLNSKYTIEHREDGFYISGGERFKNPVLAVINGSTYGGSVIKDQFIGRGMHLEFIVDKKTIVTSPIQEVEEI